MSWKDVSFVLKSKKRRELLLLLEIPKTPTQISKYMKASLPNISLKLSDFIEMELVECINPKDVKGKIYRLTDKGKEVVKKIKEMESDKR